ncbi:PIG-L family deacetylase, partial [Streptomyces sp. WAC06614]|uniref:PIG-L family deacetylase n=1 Tax=Streptomyces sp. WAC06614 TaxID=2487416 RepID=UPI000F79CCD4
PVLYLLAHPGDALAATGSELHRDLAAPDRPVAVVCLAAGERTDRDRLLHRLGRDAAWHHRTEELPDGESLDVHSVAGDPCIEVCFTDPGRPLPADPPEPLVDRVTALLARFAPATVRTLDPDPEHTGWSEEHGAVRPDHPEHSAVAQALLEAVHRATADGAAPVAVECFRPAAPCTGAHPVRIPAVVRYPGRRVWLTRGPQGHLTAYAALGGAVARWTERTPGGPDWSGRELLRTPRLLPFLAVAQAPVGWVHLVSLRRTPLPSGGATVEVMHAVQYQSGRPVGEWRSLGNPHGTGHDKGREVGVPAVVVDPDGCAHVYVRNFGRGVSARSQRPDGSWAPWRDLGGSEVQDGLAALLDDRGRPELFAPSTEGVLRWHRDDAGELRPTPRERMPLVAAPGTALAALASGPGRITVYGCDARDRMLYACRTDGAATAVGTAGGAGVCVLRTPVDGYDCTVLLQRSAEGVTAVGAYPTEQEHAGLWWERTGGPGTREPAAAVDAFGRLVVASLDPDGRLAVARQDGALPGLVLGGWTTA